MLKILKETPAEIHREHSISPAVFDTAQILNELVYMCVYVVHVCVHNTCVCM